MRKIIPETTFYSGIFQKISRYLPFGDNFESTKNITYYIYFNSVICAVFLLMFGYGYYFQESEWLSILNLLKYPLIPMIGFSIYGSHKLRKINPMFPIIGALILLWFMGFDFAYRWDAIQHVARAKFFMDHNFFGSSDRNSILYLIWGFMYRILGESEGITHLTNMIIDLAGIFGIFFIAKEIYNEFVGLISIVFSLTLPVFFLVNKWAYLDMPFVTFIVITFLFLIKFIKTKNVYFLLISLFLAFISTGIKEPGIILFPLIGLLLYKYKHLSKFNILAFISSFCITSFYIFFTFLTKPGMTAILNTESEFSIVTPLTYGFDTLFLWSGSLSQELYQILYTGLLFVAILAFHKKQNKFLYYSVIFFEILLLIGISVFPTTNIFNYPVIPFGNFNFYLFVFSIFLIVISLLYFLKKSEYEFDQYSFILLSWIGIFLLFFLINTKLFGYGIKNPLEVPVLDYRYLLPAFPPLVILFSKGISNILDLSDRKIKSIGLIVISLILVLNIILSLNLAFYFANSGNTHLKGYEYAKNISQNGIIYSEWPFNYQPGGQSYDIGKFSWARDNLSYTSIESSNYVPGSILLISGHFFPYGKFLNVNFTAIPSKSFYLDPMLPKISEISIDSVYLGTVPDCVASLSDGFYPSESWNSVTTYWTKKDSEIRINSSRNQNISLSFTGQSLSNPRTLDIYANENFIATRNISTTHTNVIVEFPINSGENIIYLRAQENCTRPYDILQLRSNDKRCLSIAIREINIRSSNF